MLNAAAILAFMIASGPLSAEEKNSVFIGHYGTTIDYPDGLRTVNALFGDEADEIVVLKGPSGDSYFVRICSKAARPGQDAKSLARDIVADAKARGLALKPVQAGKGIIAYHAPEAESYQLLQEKKEYVYQSGGKNLKIALSLLIWLLEVK